MSAAISVPPSRGLSTRMRPSITSSRSASPSRPPPSWRACRPRSAPPRPPRQLSHLVRKLHAVAVRQVHVDECGVRLRCVRRRDRAGGVLGRRRHLEAGLCEDPFARDEKIGSSSTIGIERFMNSDDRTGRRGHARETPRRRKVGIALPSGQGARKRLSGRWACLSRTARGMIQRQWASDWRDDGNEPQQFAGGLPWRA
jgi:hypothetical protein